MTTRVATSRALRAWVFMLAMASGGFGLGAPAGAQPANRVQKPVKAGLLLGGPIGYRSAIYFASPPAKPPMRALRDALAAVPGAPKQVVQRPDRLDGAVVLAALNTNVQKDYAPPDAEMVQRFGRGLTREQALAVQRAQQALVLDFIHPRDASGIAHRASLKLVERIARETQGLLWDEETREIFTPDEWQARRVAGWQDDVPDVSRHTVIHAYRSGDLVRAISLGMAKFGAPDVVVSDFAWSANASVGRLMNAFSQQVVEGASVVQPGLFDLELRRIRHGRTRDDLMAVLLPNALPSVRLSLVEGRWERGDPRNRLIEVGFDLGAGPDRHARQDSVLNALFGSQGTISYVRQTDELRAASEAARLRLPALRTAFNAGLRPGEFIQVKAPFATRSGGTEWMWVEVTAWKGDAITGLLKNQPANVAGLHVGQIVTVSQAAVYDYLRQYPSGETEGNETGKLMQRMQGRK